MPEGQNRFSRGLFVAGKAGAYLIITLLFLIAFSAVVNYLPLPAGVRAFHFAIASLLAGLVANWICMRLFERGRLIDIGLHWNPRNLLIGLAAGVSSALLVTILPVAAHMAAWQRTTADTATPGEFLLVTGLLFVAAANEEVQVRGYLLQVLMRAMGLVPAAALTALLFTSGHLGNPNVSALGMINTFIAGFALATAFWSSGELWFPIGIHFGWNFLLATSGANLSGFSIRMTPVEMVWNVGAIWSGGEYGPEGGLLTTGAFLLWFAWMWKAPIDRRVPFMLSRREEPGMPVPAGLGLTPPDREGLAPAVRPVLDPPARAPSDPPSAEDH